MKIPLLYSLLSKAVSSKMNKIKGCLSLLLIRVPDYKSVIVEGGQDPLLSSIIVVIFKVQIRRPVIITREVIKCNFLVIQGKEAMIMQERLMIM